MSIFNFRYISRSAGVVVLALAGVQLHAADMAKHVVRATIAGIDVIEYPTDIKDVVTIVGSSPAGDTFAADNIAVATLTGTLLDKGTATMDKFAIAGQLDRVGAKLGFSVGQEVLSIQARSLKADLPLVLKIMADELRHPAFTAEEFDKAKIAIEGGLQQQAQSTDSRAAEAFNRAIFPEGHPNRPASLDEWHTALGSATLAQVKAFHEKFYGPSHMVLVVVGDLDIAKINTELKKDFAGWSGGAPYRRASKPAALGAPVDQTVNLAGKTSVSVFVGQATGLRFRDPDSLALRAGAAVLGSGFTSRLLGRVRDKEGLTYSIAAGISDDTFDDGDWRIYASFAPTLLDKGLAATQRELHLWWQDGISADELAARKTDMIGAYQVSLATTGGIAGTLLRTVQRGLPLTWMDQYPKSVDALTLDQVNGAIKRYVDPKKLVIIKSGSVIAAVPPK
jgi:zinc protease